MNRTCTLYKNRRPHSLRRTLLLILSVLLALLLLFDLRIYPGAAALAEAAVRREAEGLLAAAFLSEMTGEGITYTDLITLRYRGDGVLSTLTCDTPRLTALRNRLMLSVLKELDESIMQLSLPLGTVVGGDLLSGCGPMLKVRVLLARDATARIESEFREVGINQSLHRVLFTVEIHMTVMLPSRPLSLTVRESYPIAETVIVGEVPDAYTEIHRLTDDITEQEIDDIYDFGAQGG